jgi:hypothetical protein
MSVAKTPEKAMAKLKCKGWAKMSVCEILTIPGLSIVVKREDQEDPQHPDTDLLEIAGLPLFEDLDVGKITNYAMALVSTVKESRRVKTT